MAASTSTMTSCCPSVVSALILSCLVGNADFFVQGYIHCKSRSLITKSDITNSGYNEAQKLVLAKILLYMNRNASVIANSRYNEISVLANWFCYPQWTIMPFVTNRPLITNHMFGPCEKFKPDITKWLLSVREPFLQNNGW